MKKEKGWKWCKTEEERIRRRKEHKHRYYLRNRAKILEDSKEYGKAYREKNRDKLRAYARKRQRLIRKEYKDARIWVIQQLGNKCLICGYHKCMPAIEIHHKNPSLKPKGDKAIRDKIVKWYRQKFIPKEEKKNLILFCSNCHKEYHYCGLSLEE